MKTNKLTLLFALTLFLSTHTFAQNFSKLDKSPMDIAAFPTSYKDANKLIKIAYSRPQLKGRTLDSLLTKGKVWRTGANEAAEITFYQDMMLGETKITKGTYSLATIPGDNEWTIIINKDLNTWGAYFYNQDHDIARLNVPVKTGSKPIEAFAMVFTNDENTINLNIGWDTLRLVVPFKK